MMKKIVLLGLILFGLSQQAMARITIEITEGTEGTAPVAVVPFAWQGPAGQSAPEDMAAIIEANLRRSGRFSLLKREEMLSRPSSSVEVNFKDWRLLGSDHIVIGKIRPTDRDEYLVQVQLVDILRQKQLAGFSYPVHKNSMRRLAHQVSDVLYEKLTGEKGAFNTRIAYITSTGGKKPTYRLHVADADGYNAQSIMSSKDPVMSPAWSADGQHLAYVSFEGRRSQIYVQEILTGKRQRISQFEGINGAPAWSPDGRRLALTLSHKGNPDIYIYDMSTRQFSQLTTNVAIDTEPSWSPDGSKILFTSDRGGKPQLYQVPALGGQPLRITFEGDYNARGSYSPDGKYIVMVHGRDKRYRIAIQETRTGQLTILTDGRLDESPSFAPNGRIVLYATARGNTGVLSAVSVDGRSQHRLVSPGGDIREPAWSPYNQ
jgi:TolB protein